MRSHISYKNENISDTSGLNIWTSNGQFHSIETVGNINGIEAKPSPSTLSTLYTLDSVSQSYKRKILECEKDDFEDRFNKMQRKRQMLRVKANLVVDDFDDDEDDDDDEKIYQMDWIDGENLAFHLWKEKDIDVSYQDVNSNSPVVYMPKFNFREERRHLLHISMAKIRGVDDPEAYLRRSVLINNTVKRLQKDVVNHTDMPSPSSSLVHENIITCNESNNWDLVNSLSGMLSQKHNFSEANSFNYSKHIDNSDSTNYAILDVESSTQLNFHTSVISPFIPEKSVDVFQTEILHNSFISKSPPNDQSNSDLTLSCRTLKQVNSLHMFSSQPCGLQYRSLPHEDTTGEYPDSVGSSLLDSVVYHSLIASLET